MKSKNKLSFVIAIVLLSITSVYSLNLTEKENLPPTKLEKIPLKKEKFNWLSYENIFEKYSSNYSFDINNDRTVTISNKKINSSRDDSFEDNKGNNYPTEIESGNIRWKGFRFINLNIPANAIINNVELTLYGYKQGNTTVNVKAENLWEPTSYSDGDNYLSTRNTTSKSVDWYIPKLSNGLELKSPNLKDIVQEVVDNHNGLKDISIIIQSSKKWEGWNFDDRSSSYYPKIDISYTIANPIANDDVATIDENTKATIKIFDNDKNIPSNANFWVHKTPKNGFIQTSDINNTPQDKSDDVIIYTPNQNFDGVDSFEYTVCDNKNNCDKAIVNVTVNSVVDPCDPVASGNIDTDKDGVSDICDLDDDNDGILDEDECPEVNPFTFKLNANNKTFTNSNTKGDVGDVMVYKNVGTYNGTKIDLKVTVTANSDPENMTVDISGFKFGEDLYPVLLGGENKQEVPYASVKFEFLKNGSNQLVNVAPSFMFKDVDFLNDGTGESVEINKNLVSSYSLSKNPATNLYIAENITKNYSGTTGDFLRINSKKESSGLNNEDLWINLQLLEVNSFNINFLKRTGNTGYVFESDNFSKSANTIQLDANCSLDTDNDSIPDYLDTDSDNDGCPDATEAEKNLTTTETLAGGSNGGSSGNLGTKSNKNGIPIPFGSTNGNETRGQKITAATKTAERISLTTSEFTIIGNNGSNVTLAIDATATKTNTFANGVPNYDAPNGTDTSSSLSYKWYKSTNVNNILSTKKAFDINNVRIDQAGEYSVLITGANLNCPKEITFTLKINDTPSTQTDYENADEDAKDFSVDVLKNDDFGNDGPNEGAIKLVSDKSENNGTITVNDNGTPLNPSDDKLLYTPFPNFNGRDTFDYTITDANGDTATGTVSIFVRSVNDLPTAKADAITIDEDSPQVKINVTDNDDFGGDGPNKGKIVIYNKFTTKRGQVAVDDNGTPKDPTDDAILYTPPASFNGVDDFSYNIIDANGNRSQAKVTITLNAINDVPTTANDTATVDEDSENNYINVLDNDDFGGDGTNSGTITLPNATSSKGGLITVNDNNTPNNPSDDAVLYSPVANFNGQDTFSYSITDSNGDVATATVTVTVNSVNDKPTAAEDTFTVNEDTSNNTLAVLANDSFGGDGANSGKISLSLATSNKGGTISVDDNGTPTNPTDDKILYTPTANFNGSDFFEYTITDADGDISTTKANITVTAVNDLPTAADDAITIDEDSSNNTISVLTNDSFGGDGFADNASIIIDLENSTGTAEASSNGTSSDPTDDVILYTPAENFNGTDTFTYTIIDANGDEATATVTVTVNAVNDTPTAKNDTIAVEEDSTNNSIKVTDNDDFGGDGANAGTISLPSTTSTENGTLSVDNNATTTDPTDDKIVYTPFANYQGQDSFTYVITDADGDTSTATVTITVSSVNDVPVTANDDVTVDEDSIENLFNVLANDSFGGDGHNSGKIVLSDLVSSKKGTLAVDDNGTATDPTDDKIKYTPLADFNGSDTFTYSIIDANGDSASATVSVTVNSVNDLPTAVNDSFSVDEDSSRNIIRIFNNDSYGGDGKPTSNYFEYTNPNQGGNLLIRPSRGNRVSAGVEYDIVYYTPAANFNGSETFTYTITDTNGDTSTATVTITVNGVNDTPSTSNDSYTVEEDSANNSFTVLANDDFGGDGTNSGTITLPNATSNKGGLITVNYNNTPNNPSDDVILYSPDANFNGQDTFDYTITDSNGDTSTATVTITVNDVNDVPIASNDVVTVTEDSSDNSLTVLANDDFGGDGANTGKIILTNEVSAENGTLSVDDNGTPNNPTDDKINYTPVANFNGTDTFSYSIIDANGDTSIAEVTITITSVNDTPTAVEDTATVDEDSTNNNLNVVLNDDFGGDGANAGTITLVNTTSQNGGTLSVDNNSTATDPTDDKIIYTPTSNFNGTDTFDYTITDANGDTSNTTVTVTVNAVNDVPTANDDTIIVDEDSTTNTINVLTNDDFGGDGKSDSAIQVATSKSEKGGTIAVNDNGTPTNPSDDTITYTPEANFNGSDKFTYLIVDTNGDTSSASVSITVNAVNDLPLAEDDSFTVEEDSSNNIITIFTNDSYGGDGKPSRNYLEVGTPNQGGRLLVRASRGNRVGGSTENDIIYYTPAPDFNGIETFTYSIIDADGDKSEATVTITVTGVNDSPVTINDNITVDENSTNTSINVLENDSFGGDGASSGTITITSDKSLKGGTIIIDDNATPTNPTDDKITYTPLANFTGIDSFEYTITDADGETSNGTVTVTVNPVGTKYNPLAITECFNIFVQNNLTLGSGKTHGNIATGGNLEFKENYSISSEDCGCFAVNDVKIGLLVGKKVIYPQNGILSISNENQYVKIGEDGNGTVWYQDPENSFENMRITPQADYNASSYIQLARSARGLGVSNSENPVIEKDIIDFDNAFQQLQTASLSMSSEDSNTSILNTSFEEIPSNNLPSEIVINLENNVNYLNLTGENLNKITSIDFYEKPSEDRILIINIDASETLDWTVANQKNIDSENAAYVIYNFHNTTSLNIVGENSLFGSVLAPNADITKTVNKATLSGQIIGKSLNIDGSEVECAVFESSVYSPEDAKVAPTADYTINDNDQCLVGNSFEFSNTSNTGANTQPTAIITYAWDFGDGTTSSLMNPIKTYDEAGAYTVKLTATNAYGSSEKISQINVEGVIIADVVESNSTKDEDAGSVTKEFTLNNDSEFTNYSWALDEVGTNLFPNEKTVSFEFTQEGQYVLSITTFNGDCNNSIKIPVTITSDEVSTGNDGGLESESLGGALSKRYLRRKMNSVPTIFKKTNDIIYNKKKMVKSLAKKSSDLTLLEMFPERLVDGDVAHVTSPTDILDFTVADEVLSVDFSVDDKTIGVVLGVKTLDQIYNHTKATCDRLRGAEILDVKTVEIDGYSFLQQAIQQRDGIIEHAISFAVSKNNTEEFYKIQTNWYVFDYIAANNVFNFQVWASDPANTQKMVLEILTNLKNSKPVEQSEKQKIPRTYVTKVARVSNILKMDLKSFEEVEDLEISMTEKLTETTTNLNSKYSTLNSKTEQTLELVINDGYEYDGDVIFDGEVQDAFYHADGNWGLDYDRRYTTVNEYEVTNNLNREYKDDEMLINRNVHVKAYSEFDYLAVFKALLPGNLAADYSEYKYLSFTASGQGPTQLVLVKSGIENWSEQYRATVNLTDEEQTFFIPFESFTSTASTNKIAADDLTTVSFTYVATTAGTNNLDMKISDVKFTKTNTALNVDEFVAPKENEFFVYPNPSKGSVNCTVFSNTTTKAKATLFDITGKTIYKGEINLSQGKNKLNFNFNAKAGVMFLRINSTETNYGTSKIIFK
ncbi:tandem-95 repeat protein [Polaribacter porphyrae]|uniref:Tandem-95 repeat protein n=1 Tax=Polaribacter porphyrae TaxID=1137780 RepID=A0A2S7WKR9_9FLAO|nr:Ig-like domain-containing protein [Polaribacter porphyrae]PQJ77892.1 hypothetical protein BTO18_01250 [Polaribacter porphyrae]